MSQGMTGEGDYDQHSGGQRQDAASLVQLVVDAAARIEPDPARGTVVIADYGSAQGRASVPLVKSAIEQIRAHLGDVPIAVVHNDVLANDWTGLFANLRDGDSYLGVGGGPITPMTSACSFYEPVTPPGFVDLGMSFAALQWLADPGPGGTGDALYFDQLTGAAAGQMADQAHRDWTHLLSRRADELAPGARMVLDMMGRHDDGEATGHLAWTHVASIARELVEEGRLDPARLDSYVFPVYERTLDEVRRPFDGTIGDRLVLEHLALDDSVNPVWAAYQESRDLDAFAAGFVGFFRAFSEPSLVAALDPDGSALDELYRRLADAVRTSPDDFAFTIHVLSAVIAAKHV